MYGFKDKVEISVHWWDDDEIPEGEENYPTYMVHYMTYDYECQRYEIDVHRGEDGHAGMFLSEDEAKAFADSLNAELAKEQR